MTPPGNRVGNTGTTSGAAAFFRSSPPWRSFGVGLLGAVSVHAFLFAVLPERLSRIDERERERTQEIEWVVSEPDSPAPLPDEYVATNPEVPSNEPAETQHFASRDQQAQQEEPSEDETPDETPEVEGEDLRSQNIVEGDPMPRLPGGASAPEELSPIEDFPMIPERRPVPGFEDMEPDPEETGIAMAESEEDPGEDRERVVGINVPEEARERYRPTETARQSARPEPEPRPSLPRTHSGPVAERSGSASRVGEIAIDARRSEFGTYLERMLEAIERQWWNLARAHAGSGDAASRVRIRFELDSSGRVEIVDVDSSATLTGTLICQDAIESRAPFGNWSDEMIKVLGESQTLTITFHYR